MIGCDDSRLARLTHIHLTTLAQDPEQMAQLAVKAVIWRLEGDPGMPPRDILLDAPPGATRNHRAGPSQTHPRRPVASGGKAT